MWWVDGGWGGWSMPGMFFGPLTFIVVCMVVMFVMMRRGMAYRDGGNRALDILKERYARGEITQSEYEERRRFLGA
jgi:putative membrane protein